VTALGATEQPAITAATASTSAVREKRLPTKLAFALPTFIFWVSFIFSITVSGFSLALARPCSAHPALSMEAPGPVFRINHKAFKRPVFVCLGDDFKRCLAKK
jgi:hypothetical protein